MNIRFKALRGQSGAALVVLLALLLLVSAAILLDRLNSEASAGATTATHASNAKALAEAKAALIAWAATYPPSAARESTVGTLPFPDRDGDGNYDGMADCDALGVNDLALVGRLPRLGEDNVSVGNCGVINPLNVDLRDGAGEPLWYAVSRNVLPGVGVAGGPINPDMGGAGRMAYPWIKLKDAQGNDVLDPNTGAALAVAAVIFAPGAIVGNQDRNATAAANYLDSITIGATTYDNADADGCPDNTAAPCGGAGEEFVVYPNPAPGDAFNDELIYITVNDLMRAAEKRVLGEVDLALDAYRTAGWNTNNVFPWLAGFRSPRAVAAGTADSGSATHLDQAAGNFIVKGVQLGDIVFNTDDGSRGPVTAVTATRIDFDALAGGTENDVDAGENFVVEPSFKSTVARGGHLPVHLPNEIFSTTFDVILDIHSVDEDDTGSTGPASLIPDDDVLQVSTFPGITGRCLWTEAARVDCKGRQEIAPYFRTYDSLWVDKRTIEISVSFTGTFTITPPTATEPRRRNVTTPAAPGPPYLEEPVVQPAPMLPQDLWTIIVTDELAGDQGIMRIDLDDSDGSITVNNIRYDLSVVYDGVDDAKDEVPEWFAENNWHHFIYVAASQDLVVGGNADADDNCTTPINSCLSMNANGVVARTDIPALLISSGVQWTNQDRDIGDCDGDGGGPLTDPTDDSFLCAYFDGDTTIYDVSTDILRHGANTLTVPADWYARDTFGLGFNDQIRTID
jgi:hypothetical protein